MLMIAAAGSPASLKSKPIKYALCDELDELEWDLRGRGDPLGLIRSRKATFPNRKELLISTPTVEGASRIADEHARSDQKVYALPCPHCGEPQALEWQQLQWTPGLERVYYVCAHNGCVIDERDKGPMLAAGRWHATNPDADPRVSGYHLNALSPEISPGIVLLAPNRCGWPPVWSETHSRSYGSSEGQGQACRGKPGAR